MGPAPRPQQPSPQPRPVPPPAQDGRPAVALVTVRSGRRAGYGKATGITRLVMLTGAG
jgi:hypothetical protein